MSKIIFIIVISLVGAFGVNKFQTPNIWDSQPLNLGAISYPTSLDSLTNPSGTDSVATVSHSAQHSNANDAIESLEAKLGIGASTAVSNSVLQGNGAGSSAWSTSLTLSGQGIFGSFISNASSTIIGGLNITGNSTSTNATSTIGAFTDFATTTKLFGAGLGTCSGSNFLQWTAGSFGCAASAGGVVIVTKAATTTTVDASITAATTTTVTSGESLMIWSNCVVSPNATYGLYVKPVGVATSTLQLTKSSNDALPQNVSLQGIFTAGNTVPIEIYIGDNTASKNYISCTYPAFMFIKFSS